MQLSRLPTLSQLLSHAEHLGLGQPACRSIRHADRQWRSAVDALNILLDRTLNQNTTHSTTDGSHPSGLVLSAPTPILSDVSTLDRLATWTISPTSDNNRRGRSSYCLPSATPTDDTHLSSHVGTLSLPDDDPLIGELFCLAFTAQFSVLMVRGTDLSGCPAFQFSFEPQIVDRAWQVLRDRLLDRHPQTVAAIDRLVRQFPPIAPHYTTVVRFSQAVLQTLPDPAATDSTPNHRIKSRIQSKDWTSFQTTLHVEVPSDRTSQSAPDVELLQALAHEVRTPLSTIRTLTKMLLKRKDLASDVQRWLQQIDRECSEQIDRFGLIFKAVELETCETKRSSVHLTRTSLADVVNSCIPRWQKQAGRRNLKLDVLLPPQMPQVVSDPNLLDRVLTGAFDRFISGLPLGSDVQVKVMPAGHQLKLQLKAHACEKSPANPVSISPLKSIGQLLTFQPETGNISLNLSVTKNLFQALGGKLIVRKRRQQGEVLTIFLPLE